MLTLIGAASVAVAQTEPPASPSPAAKKKAVPAPAKRMRLASPGNVPEGWADIQAVTETREGVWRRLRGAARIETSELLLKADEIDYNDESGDAQARGHVYLQHFEGGDEIFAERADYNVAQQRGKFYVVHGTSPVRIEARRGILPTENPFRFEGKWAESPTA